MPASQGTTHTRRSIQRFVLENISIDDRPNVYKSPQLVLKPLLELAPRRPYTGSRPRMPVWRHFLMVHVKDKADELVKLDLASFKQPSVVLDPVLRHSVTCLPSEQSLIFRHPNATENGSSMLSITLQKASDLDVVLGELDRLNISVEYKPASQGQSPDSGFASSGVWAQPDKAGPPVFMPFKHLRQLNSSNPPSGIATSSQDRYHSYPESSLHGGVLRRPPSQPVGQPANLPLGQRPWSPAFIPSRPATTMGVPGVLGEGIYKIRRVGSTSSARPRLRRTATILEHQGPKMYTVSKHFDKTLSRGDIVPVSRGLYMGRRLSSSLRADDTALGVARFSGPHPSTSDSHDKPGQEYQIASQPPARMPSILEGVSDNIQYRVGPRRLRTIDDASTPELSAGLDGRGHQSFAFTTVEGHMESAYSQPEPTSRVTWPSDDASITSSSQTLLELPNRQDMEDDWLLRISQIQHEGLCEASMIWDDLMGRASVDTSSMDRSGAVSDVLAKYEGEFTRRWDAVLGATGKKMREARVGGFAY